MRSRRRMACGVLIVLMAIFLLGCQGIIKRKVKPKVYAIPQIEAEWIRNGEPIEFENELWFPMDSIENLLDNELYLLGEYRGLELFVEKIDVRPYRRLYTKFGKNKFRPFAKDRKSD